MTLLQLQQPRVGKQEMAELRLEVFESI